MEIAKSVESYLKTGSWSDSSAYNPVIREAGATWLQFDAVRIGNCQDSAGGVLVQYLWRGWAVAWIRFDGARLDGIRHFTQASEGGRIRL